MAFAPRHQMVARESRIAPHDDARGRPAPTADSRRVFVVIVPARVPKRHGINFLPQQRQDVVFNEFLTMVIRETTGQSFGDAQSQIRLPQKQHPAIRTDGAPVNAPCTFRPPGFGIPTVPVYTLFSSNCSFVIV